MDAKTEQRIIDLYLKYNCARLVCQEIQVSYQTVYRTLIKHGIPRTAPKKEKDERPRCQKRSFCYALVLMLYTFGYHTKEIAEAAGASSSGVHNAATRRGLIAPKKRNAKRPEDIEKDRNRPKRKRGCKKFYDYDSLVELYQSGMGTQEVADALGVGKTTVLKHLKLAGAEIRVSDRNKTSHEALIARIESTSSPFVHYVSGDKKTGVTLKCDKCGQTFIYRSVWNVRFRCPNCEPVPNRLTEEQKAAKEKAHLDSLLDREHVCQECGKVFTERERYGGGKISGKYKFCSLACNRRYQNRKNNPKRREKYGAYSNWRKIARRDGNLCYLCGKPIDPTDYKRIDNVFMSGPSFGSVDHLVPYKDGGVSDEDNLFLAHLSCNSAKGDKSLLRYLVEARMEVSA